MVSFSDHLNWLNSEWRKLTTEAPEGRLTSANRIKNKLESLVRQGSSEIVAKLINEMIKKLQEIFLSNSSTFDERHGSLSLITSICSISAEEICSQIPKFIHILHLEINGRRDPESMEQAAVALASVISNSGILANELVLSETSTSIEKLQDNKNDHNVFGGAITLLALANSPSSSIVAQNLPAIFDVIWYGLYNSKCAVREKSAELVGACLKLQATLGNHGRAEASNVYRVYRSRILDESVSALSSGIICNVHGALLTLKALFNLSESDSKFIMHNDSYNLILDIVMKLIYSKDSNVRQTAIDFVPLLSSRDLFIEAHLSKWMTFLIDSIKKEKDRHCALKALTLTISAMDAKSIEPFLETLTSSLKAMLHLKGKYRDLEDLNCALDCICALSETCGPIFQRFLFQLFPAMTSSGLWTNLIESLQTISRAIPNIVYFIEDSLMAEIKSVLCDEESSVENLVLAIKCLGSFEFTEPILSTEIGQRLTQVYLNHPNPLIRRAAAESILLLICHLLHSTRSSEPKWIARNFITSVLTRMVADEDFHIPERILSVLKTNQCSELDILLAHSDCIRPLFIFLGSNNVPLQLREECADLLCRVTSINFASCLPNYRKILLQYLSEIECIKTPGLLHREDSAKLLHKILLWDEAFVVPYAEALLENIIKKLEDKQISFSESMLNCVSRLTFIKPDCVVNRLEVLLNTLSRLIQDQSSTIRRKAALSAMSVILRKVDRELIPGKKFSSIMLMTIAIIKNELDHSVRREAIRLMGVIGAIDPYMIKGLETPTASLSRAEEASSDSVVNISTAPEEFYAKNAVESLLSILKDTTLSMHHMAAAQALVYLFRTLGPKSNQFLAQVLPVFYSIVRNCPPSSAEFYFQQLAVLVGVVGVHIGPHVGEIVNLLANKWDSQQPCYPALLNLINVLAQALKGEFRPFVPRILPAILTILESDSAGMAARPFTIQKALQTVAVLGGQISDYAGVIGDALVLLLRNSANFRDVRIAALRSTASICKDVSAVADNPAILQSLLGILEGSDDAEIQEYCLDAMVVVALAQGRVFFRFIPLLAPVIARKRIQHAAFDKLLTSHLNSPAKLAELTSESLRLMELKISDLTLVAGDFGGIGGSSNGPASRPLAINEGFLLKSFDPSQCVDREHWFDWIRRLGVELLRESPSPALRSCASLANIYYPLSKELFNAAFASCLSDLSMEGRSECLAAVEMALASPIIPSEVAQQLLNVAEFMQRQERPLPIGMHTLGTQAARFHAYAKALYYKELEFTAALQSGISPSSQVIEALISINNQVQHPDAALGVLIHANRVHGIVLKESWYEKLQRWDEALRAYEAKWQDDPSSYEADFGILRCRHALGEWDELNGVAQEIWPNAQESVRSAIAPLAAASAWGLQDWPHLQQYAQALKPDSADSIFFQTILSIHSGKMKQARQLIDRTRDVIDTELTALLSESYSRAYNTVVRVQMLTELEEVAEFLEKESDEESSRKILTKSWMDRLELSQSNVEVWLRILKVRSLVITPQSDPAIWIRFASMCRKSGRPHLARKILSQLISSENENAIDLKSLMSSENDPQVVYAYLKYLWECEGDRSLALRSMKMYARHLAQLPETLENSKLLARCYYKSSNWDKQLLTDNSSEDQYKAILDGYLAATSYDKTWHKAWHGWALMNFEMAATWEKKNSGAAIRSGPTRINPYIVPAIQGFFRSISLSNRDSLQDSLRLLTLWFKYGSSAEINAAVGDGFVSVPVDNWLQVIPQLIARIHVTSPQVRRLVHHVLSDIGRHHPQALVYSLSVAAKSQNVTRRTAAVAILDRMRAHSATLVDQALLVGQELIRVAILWEEMWHEALEEASKLYFGEHNIPAMFGVLEPLHEQVEKGSKSAREAHFIQSYGHELREARELGIRYKQSGNSNDLNAAWDLYYQVFRRINKALPQLKGLELENVSPKLLNCRNLELAVPGTYRADRDIVRISSIEGRVGVIASKQRPRKLVMYGSDGAKHQFLLKGHEDLRQDERVMQLFVLINALLKNDPETHKRHLAIERFSVIPLSQNTGLIGWMPQCDTMHTLIKNYREARNIPLSLEHRNMLAFAPDYDHLTKLQKMEVFSGAMGSNDGGDLARAFWLLSGNAEAWLERRTNYSRSLAVMSMTGYVLGLGDRHPSNLMFNQVSGKIVHIDFGDCFEVAMQRDRFPERVPFRLTRMLVRAMEASGVEGTFRITCEETLRVLRSNKDSVMAVLEAFVYDPLINWRLLNTTTVGNTTTEGGYSQNSLMDNLNLKSFTVNETSSWAKFPDNFSNSRKIRRGSEISQLEEESLAKPEALNSGAISVINRVSSKLTGKDFRDMKPGRFKRTDGLDSFPDSSPASDSFVEWPLSVKSQVDRLIEEATRVQNLCQSYVGWCPFWESSRMERGTPSENCRTSLTCHPSELARFQNC